MRIYPFFIAHAGCPHRCIYCRQEASVGAATGSTAEVVSRELPAMLARGEGGEVAFYGGTFTLLAEEKQQAYLAAVAPYLRSGTVRGIRISTRPDGLTPARIAWLQDRGVSTIEIGCQSFSAAVLARSGRGHDPETARQAVCRVQRQGLRVGIQLMPGLPGGDRLEALDSLRQAICLRPDFLRIYPTVVLRHTRLAELYLRGDYVPWSLTAAVELGAEMLWHCRHHAVPVIRLGLQASAGLDRGDVVLAGPYHPAFGQLARSQLWLRALRSLARNGVAQVLVHPADLAEAVGNRRRNLASLHQEYPAFGVRTDAQVPRQTLGSDQGHRSLQELAAYSSTGG